MPYSFFSSLSTSIESVMNQLDVNIGKLPCCERILQLTLPIDRFMYVCSSIEVFKIYINQPISVEVLDEDPYRFINSSNHFLGVNGYEPIYQQNGNSIYYDFSPTNDSVLVSFNIADKIGKIEFDILSGDWFVASFSKCGNYLVLAEPYDFNVYKIN